MKMKWSLCMLGGKKVKKTTKPIDLFFCMDNRQIFIV